MSEEAKPSPSRFKQAWQNAGGKLYKLATTLLVSGAFGLSAGLSSYNFKAELDTEADARLRALDKLVFSPDEEGWTLTREKPAPGQPRLSDIQRRRLDEKFASLHINALLQHVDPDVTGQQFVFAPVHPNFLPLVRQQAEEMRDDMRVQKIRSPASMALTSGAVAASFGAAIGGSLSATSVQSALWMPVALAASSLRRRQKRHDPAEDPSSSSDVPPAAPVAEI